MVVYTERCLRYPFMIFWCRNTHFQEKIVAEIYLQYLHEASMHIISTTTVHIVLQQNTQTYSQHKTGMNHNIIIITHPTASDIRAISQRADIQPYSTSTSVILHLYNSSTARVCKYIKHNNWVFLKALFCSFRHRFKSKVFNSWAQA